MTRSVLRSIATIALLLTLALPAGAHPLGNFTVNQHLGLSGHGDGIAVAYVLDMAEIPAARALAGLGPQPDLAGHADMWCAEAFDAVEVTIDGSRAAIGAESARLTTPEGEAGLPTLRLECDGLLATSLPATIAIVNNNRPEQPGWREIVVDPSISGETDLLRQSPSAVLAAYPADARLLDVTSGTVVASGSTLPGPNAPGAVTSEATGIPRAVERALEATGGFGLVAIAAAFALGAGHALAPGHGKTLMAAFLLARNGTARHAVGLGLATAVSHTIGVAALGAITLLATNSLAPERLYPVLSVLSAATITALGTVMFAKSVRGRRGGHAHHVHDHPHHHDHDHPHGHHQHDRPGANAGAEDVETGRDHGHATVGWRALVALGLAGGMVPSASAVVLFLAAVRYGRPVLGLVLVALFGLGMSTVLVGAGLSVLSVRDFAARRVGDGWRFVARLQPLAGAAVAVGGVVLSVGALQNL